MGFGQQNTGFRRLRAALLHADIINLGAEITDPREKATTDFPPPKKTRFPEAAGGRPPPQAGKPLPETIFN